MKPAARVRELVEALSVEEAEAIYDAAREPAEGSGVEVEAGGRTLRGINLVVQNGDPFTYFNDTPLHVAEHIALDSGDLAGVIEKLDYLTGTLGVEVLGGGGVFEGGRVSVGTAVVGAAVNEGVMATAVGVSVGTLDGKLQASIARTRASVDNKLRDFIASLL